MAGNGFDALREYDTNANDLIDPADARWNTLLLWFDDDHDAWSDPGELRTVASSGITAFDTNTTGAGGAIDMETSSDIRAWFTWDRSDGRSTTYIFTAFPDQNAWALLPQMPLHRRPIRILSRNRCDG